MRKAYQKLDLVHQKVETKIQSTQREIKKFTSYMLWRPKHNSLHCNRNTKKNQALKLKKIIHKRGTIKAYRKLYFVNQNTEMKIQSTQSEINK